MGISWVQIPALPSSSSVTLGKTSCHSELQFHLLEMGLMYLAHKRPAVCVSHWSSCPRWCWDPGFLLPPNALPMVPWGLGPSPVGPVRLLGQGRAGPQVPHSGHRVGFPGILPALTPTWFLPSQPTTRSSWWLRRECSEARRRLQCRGRGSGRGWMSSTGGRDTGRGGNMS